MANDFSKIKPVIKCCLALSFSVIDTYSGWFVCANNILYTHCLFFSQKDFREEKCSFCDVWHPAMGSYD